MDCSPPGSSVHGIFQARLLEWVAISFSSGSSQPGINPRSPAWQADALPSVPPGRSMNPCKYFSCFFSSRSPHLLLHFSHTSPVLLRQHATSPLPQDLCTSRSCELKALSHVCTQLPPSLTLNLHSEGPPLITQPRHSGPHGPSLLSSSSHFTLSPASHRVCSTP